MVKRRTILKSGIALGTSSLAGIAASGIVGASTDVVVHDFDGSAYPGNNDLGNWADGGSLANGGGSGTVSDGALRLEYNASGWFGTNVGQSVADTPYLHFVIRGDDGGEEDDVGVTVGDASAMLSEASDDAVTTEWSVVTVDLEALGADLEDPQSIRLNFWQGNSGAVEIARIAFSDSADASVPDDIGDGTDDGDDTDEGGESDGLVVNDFQSGFPGQNALGEWADAGAFESTSVASGILTLEFDDAGWFASNVMRDVSEYSTLTLVMRRTEQSVSAEDIQVEVGSREATLAEVTDDEIAISYGPVTVDLDALGVDRSMVDNVRLNFWQDGSGTVEIREIGFGPIAEREDTGGEDEADRYWEVEAGNEKEPDPADTLSAAEITAETTVAELCPTYDQRPLWIPRNLRSGLETKGEHPGDVDITQTNLSDGEKAALYDVDVEAVQGDVGDLPLGALGTQALDHVKTYVENSFPYHAIAKLLPRLALLPDETEHLTYHKSNSPWDETAGPATPVNDPGQFVQEEWPTDAYSYEPQEKMERDRIHDQMKHERADPSRYPEGATEWTEKSTLSDDVYYDENHPLVEAIRNGEHPVTGESLGDGPTANARMEVEARVHTENSNHWYQVFEFTNTQDVPYYLDGAILWWVGPMGLSDLRNGHYNNVQRPGPGLGHPQRDIIEVVYDEERSLSAYAVRIAQHDEPYHMRTAYPNQKWSIEQGVPASIDGEDRFTTSEERQELVDTMLNTLHVELESDLDRNNDLLTALQMRNRMTN